MFVPKPPTREENQREEAAVILCDAAETLPIRDLQKLVNQVKNHNRSNRARHQVTGTNG